MADITTLRRQPRLSSSMVSLGQKLFNSPNWFHFLLLSAIWDSPHFFVITAQFIWHDDRAHRLVLPVLLWFLLDLVNTSVFRSARVEFQSCAISSAVACFMCAVYYYASLVLSYPDSVVIMTASVSLWFFQVIITGTVLFYFLTFCIWYVFRLSNY